MYVGRSEMYSIQQSISVIMPGENRIVIFGNGGPRDLRGRIRPRVCLKKNWLPP